MLKWWFRPALLPCLRTLPYCLFLSKWKADDHSPSFAPQSSPLTRAQALAAPRPAV